MEIEQIKEYQVFTNVGNAYLQALTSEKLYIVGGPEFEELQGHVLVMYKALYGTRSGGACWHDKFFDILHHMGFKTSEVDWGGHDPNPNHVNESLLSEADWGAHNPDAHDPEQLTGESIQSFLTFIVQLQWLVALGRLYLHKSLPCLVEFWGLPPLILFFNTSTGWFGRFVLSTECYRTRKRDYNDLNWPRCSAWVTESLVLTDGGFC